MIYSYPDYFCDMFHGYTVDTKALFDLFNCRDPAALCVNISCDYTNSKSQSFLNKDLIINVLASARWTDRQKMIYKVFT